MLIMDGRENNNSEFVDKAQHINRGYHKLIETILKIDLKDSFER